MKRLMALGVVALAGAMGLANVARAADNYAVDPVHSSVIFKIFHFNMAPFYGRIDAPGGKFVLDGEKSTFEIELNVDKIYTGNEKRDAHLKGPDFFNAKEFPKITFKSNSVKVQGDSGFEASGDLTVHGVTKPLTVKIEKTGQGKDPMGKERAGLAATFMVKRSDFGVNYMPQGLGDEVTLMIGIEGLKE